MVVAEEAEEEEEARVTVDVEEEDVVEDIMTAVVGVEVVAAEVALCMVTCKPLLLPPLLT